MTNRQFVFIKSEYESIRANEVGILEGEVEGGFLILFVVGNKEVILPREKFEFFDVTRIGDAFPKKVCNVCHRLLDTNNFDRNQNGVNNRPVRRPSCNECRRIIDGVSVSPAERRKWAESKPHYEPFTCPICQKTTIPGLTSKVVLDHDHNTGRVRGWICDSCNTGIGRFKDDVALLLRAINFLETN